MSTGFSLELFAEAVRRTARALFALSAVFSLPLLFFLFREVLGFSAITQLLTKKQYTWASG
jgi:hypothetical protein